jgi:23S rRNA pseudouridine1911/1915/1917 synthase
MPDTEVPIIEDIAAQVTFLKHVSPPLSAIASDVSTPGAPIDADSLVSAQVEGEEAEPDTTTELVDELEPALELREIAIPVALHGERVDRVLAQRLTEFSRSYVQQLIGQGAIELVAPAGTGPAALKPATRVKAGQVYRVALKPTPQSQAFVPQAMDLRVVYEDEHLRIIDKPPGLVVHPAPGNWSGTLLNGLLALDPRAAELPRAGIVHRLDKDTSGLMLVARTRACMDRLMAQIAAREVRREYLAIVQGLWRGPETLEVDAPIGRDPQHRLRMAVVDLTRQAGKTARTTVRCLETNEQGSWVHCRLHTGRTHQIRVHLGHVGHRLYGDSQYGGPAIDGLQRQALHAFRLSLAHPITGEWLSCRADWPADLTAALQVLGLRYNEKLLPALA